MRTRHILLIPTLALLALGGGCGGDERSPSGDVSSSEANVVQKASSNAVGSLVQGMMLPDLQSLAAGQAAGAWIQGALDSFNLDGVLDNAAGGSIDFSGTGALGVDTGLVDLGFKANLKDWLDSESGLTLDGALDITTTVKSFLPPEVNVSFKGMLDVSGGVQAQVPVDLSMDLLQDSILTCGTVSALDVNVDLCGSAVTSQLASAAQLSILATAQQLQAEVLAQSATAGLPGLGGSSVNINGSLNGAGGGSLDYSGTVSVGMSGDVKADVSLTFNSWQDSAGVTLDGSLQVSQEVTAALVKSSVKGSISLNGVAGTAVDLQITVDSSDPNGAAVCGAIAGHTIAIGTCNP